MKKLWFGFLALCMFAVPSLYAQGKTDVSVLGKHKGSVSSLQTNGVTLVDVRTTAKYLGGSVELFSASKQIKVAFPGMYAILTAPQREIIVNADPVKLPVDVVATGGKIYAPVQFFMLPQVQKALNRQISFANNTLTVERNYTLAWEGPLRHPAYDKLFFSRRGNISFVSKQLNKHTAEVIFSDAVLKRDVQLRFKDDFIRSVSLSQRGKEAVLKVIFGKKGKVWSFKEENGQFVFAIAEKVLPTMSIAPAKPSQSITLPGGVSLPAEDEAEELDLTTEEELETPSVIISASDKDTSGPELHAVPGPVISPAGPQLHTPRKMRIVLDPGHGGKDPGATRKGSVREKELNLNVAKHLYNYLQKQGFEVKLTRSDDTFVTLAGRSKMANEFKADLFVSIHTNAAKKSTADGFEVYFRSDKATDTEAAEVAAFENEALQYEETHYSFVDKLLQSLAKNEYMNESSKLAGHVRNYVYKEPGIGIAVRQANAIRQANFYVLRGVQSPAVLVEMGYISSAKDRTRLNNKTVQKRMAEGIGKGIVSYAKAEGRM